jgi:hypothetical protein
MLLLQLKSKLKQKSKPKQMSKRVPKQRHKKAPKQIEQPHAQNSTPLPPNSELSGREIRRSVQQPSKPEHKNGSPT